MPGGSGTCLRMIPEITEAELSARIANANVPVLVDFTTQWCGPCRALGPILDQLAANAAGRYQIVKVDGDAWPALAGRLGVRAFPTMIVFSGGAEVARHVGLTSKSRIEALLSDSF